MPNLEPGRGGLVVRYPSIKRPWAVRYTWLALLILISLCTFTWLLFRHTSDGRTGSGAKEEISEFDLTESKSPPSLIQRPNGAYIAFVDSSNAFVFKEDRINLKVVEREDQIPGIYRAWAIEPQKGKFAQSLKAFGKPPFTQDRRPVIFYTNVDILGGYIADYDRENASNALLFKDGRVDLEVVESEDQIPGIYREWAIEPQKGKFVKPLKALRKPPFANNERPYIFYSNVDILGGYIADYDRWEGEFQTIKGNVVRARTIYDGTKLGTTRGPPESRKVYVVGRINRVGVPESFGWSKLSLTVRELDLRPPVSEFKRVYGPDWNSVGSFNELPLGAPDINNPYNEEDLFKRQRPEEGTIKEKVGRVLYDIEGVKIP